MRAGKQSSQPGRSRLTTILLVEDDVAVANVTSVWLRKLGYEVIVSHDGRSACDLAAKRSQPIDLLLTDVMLPGMRGPVLAGVIRARHPEMAVLFSSGYSPELVGELFTAHANTAMLLRKPYEAKQLAAQVQLALERKARGMRVTDVVTQQGSGADPVGAGRGGPRLSDRH
jgi:two-component system cell cycle sensor histidine kinase/response regulator CckA